MVHFSQLPVAAKANLCATAPERTGLLTIFKRLTQRVSLLTATSNKFTGYTTTNIR